MSDLPFIGQIALFPYTFAPVGWTECAGQIVAISQYSALFSLLGTAYGGNGTSTFGLPDLQGRAAVGPGTLTGGGTYAMGQKDGREAVALTDDTMPFHQHLLTATTQWGTGNTPGGNILAQVAGGDLQGPSQGMIYNPGQRNVQLSTGSIVPATDVPPRSHNNMQPSVSLRYCICLVGIMPHAS
jgi:microcystin-dependent protein